MTDTRSATGLPALSLVAPPGRRRAILDIAAEADRQGFAGIASPSLGSNMALCGSLASVTSDIPFWTSIQPIYVSHPMETAAMASHIAEVSGGRFRLGLGVSHGPVHDRLGITTGRPLADIRAYVAAVKEAAVAAAPPIWLATLRDRMLDLAVEIADGAIWANASLSHMSAQLTRVPEQQRATFALSNMIPTVVSDDRDAARAVHRKTLRGYVALPNYRNYWKAAGYVEEMETIEAALEAGDVDAVTAAMTPAWLDDCTLSGSVKEVRDGVEAWWSSGVVPIVVPSSTSGGQIKAIEEVFAAFA